MSKKHDNKRVYQNGDAAGSGDRPGRGQEARHTAGTDIDAQPWQGAAPLEENVNAIADALAAAAASQEPDEEPAPAQAAQEPGEAAAAGQPETPAPALEPDEAAPAQEPEEAAEEEQAAPQAEPAPDKAAEAAENAEAAEADGAPAQEDEAAAWQPDPETERRLAEMTRTVQVSVEQILARMESEAAPRAPAVPAVPAAEEEEDEEKPENIFIRLLKGLLRGVWGIIKWLLLVAVCVALVTGGSVWWLYRNTTEEMLPEITATFAGQTLEPVAYDWRVPVVSDRVTKRFEFASGTTQTFTEPLSGGSIRVSVSPLSYETELTIWDENDTELFSGSVPEYGQRRLTDTGSYHAKLVVSNMQERFSGTSEALGTQTYEFDFTVSVRPPIQLDKEIVMQGDVLAVMLTGTQADDLPVLETEIENAGFVRAANGWVAYLPIACDLQPDTYSVRVRTKDHVQDLSFTVRAQESWKVVDHSSRSQLISPYLGPDDTPAEVKNVLGIYDETIYWAADGGFAEPYSRTPKLRLEYGTKEYVGRSKSQIQEGSGTPRIAVNTVVNGRRGEKLCAPAAGRVLLAAELDGTGGTVVIEHGGGVKSVFYHLDSLDVQTGDMVAQGQQIGVANGNYILEARVGSVQVDPLNIWTNQCNAMRCY